MIKSQIDLGRVAKIHIDSAHVAHNKFSMFFAFSSGEQTYAFSTTPLQMKLFTKLFADNLALFEKQFGKIDMKDLEIISPIQPIDLGKPPKK